MKWIETALGNETSSRQEFTGQRHCCVQLSIGVVEIQLDDDCSCLLIDPSESMQDGQIGQIP